MLDPPNRPFTRTPGTGASYFAVLKPEGLGAKMGGASRILVVS